ncbi:MAG: pyridoxal phosphate-dependent aminotransferase [Bacteroidales bacterium]|jgi:cystathionine beta-lyase|nr:pyridoxal phosphate-dependent aminotransferase [Bacteroidales bacterium]
MSTYNFDEIIERKGTSSVKHDMMNRDFGRNDLLPMWVADMDFRSPDFVMDAIRKRCEHEVLGYTYGSRSYFEAIINWFANHYDIKAEKEELHYIPGIVAGIAFAIQSFTNVGDSILITTPVYPPFVHLPLSNARNLVCSPLSIKNGRFEIDFSDLEEKAKGCKLMILSNPHNPAGTIWSKEELKKIADICAANNCVVISDEIHADLTLNGRKHTSFSTVSEMARDISITFIAPSKTFNIPGLGSSVCYIHNEDIRNTYFGFLEGYEVANGNVFAYIGAEAAFREGEEWLKQLKVYLQKNVDFLEAYLSQNMPKIKVVLPEASYLAWLDFNAYNMEHNEIKSKLINDAKVALNDGTQFGGKDYEGCFRINIGCPQSILKLALDRIYETFGR